MSAMRSPRLALLVMIAVTSVCLAAQDLAGTAVTGFVRFASGAAIADVRVSLFVPGDNQVRTTRTGADGSYRFDAVGAGDYQLNVAHAGAVAKRITVTPGSQSKDLDFLIPDGSRRVVTARIVMNDASRGRPVPRRIGIGVRRSDGTLAVPLAPGDQRLVVNLPEGYFLQGATYGSATVYSLDGVGGRRLSSAPLSITVPPEPVTIPELIVTLGTFSR